MNMKRIFTKLCLMKDLGSRRSLLCIYLNVSYLHGTESYSSILLSHTTKRTPPIYSNTYPSLTAHNTRHTYKTPNRALVLNEISLLEITSNSTE